MPADASPALLLLNADAAAGGRAGHEAGEAGAKNTKVLRCAPGAQAHFLRALWPIFRAFVFCPVPASDKALACNRDTDYTHSLNRLPESEGIVKEKMLSQMLVPIVVESTSRGERAYDIYSRLLQDRIVFIGTGVNDEISNVIIAQLLFLQSQDATKDIAIYINSPGGSVTAGLAIYDTIQYLSCDVATYCVGQAASMGAVLLAAGRKGKRFALPNARIMIHQPWGGVEGQATDISIQAKEILRLKDRLTEILAFHTGKDVKTVGQDTERDYFLSAEDAKNYGLIDAVLTRKQVTGKKA